MDARDSADLTRRRFTKTAAALAVAPLLSMAACRGRRAPDPPGGGGGGGGPSSKKTGREGEEVDALTELVRARHGARLDPKQVEAVRASIRSNVRAAEELRDHSLPMSAGPAVGVPVPPRA